MNERFIYLMERFWDNDLSTTERDEFDNIIRNDKELKKEFEEQQKTREVLSKMRLKNPTVNIWDNYWVGIYNRIERGFAWIAIILGSLILLVYGSIELVNELLKNSEIPSIVKTGIAILTAGLIVLLFSIVREKWFVSKTDQYKEIQR